MPIVSSVAKSLPPSGTASGDLTGSYPGPTIAAGKAVLSIAKAGSTALKDAVTLTGGTNVTLTQAAQDISIAASGGSQPYYVVRYAVDHTLTPIVLHTAAEWPGDAAIGDCFVGYQMFTLVAFNGTTPVLTTYIGLDGINPGVFDHRDATIVGGEIDGYTNTGTRVPMDSPFGSANSGLLVEAGSWLLGLDDGASGDPGCTQGEAEFWFHFVKKPS